MDTGGQSELTFQLENIVGVHFYMVQALFSTEADRVDRKALKKNMQSLIHLIENYTWKTVADEFLKVFKSEAGRTTRYRMQCMNSGKDESYKFVEFRARYLFLEIVESLQDKRLEKFTEKVHKVIHPTDAPSTKQLQIDKIINYLHDD